MKKILVEISPADFLDRLSILNIKLENFENIEKKDTVRKAKASLFTGNIDQFNAMNSDEYVRKQYLALQEVNKEIWSIKDLLKSTPTNYETGRLWSHDRMCELNDLKKKRGRIKSKIDSHLESSTEEES